MGCIVDDLTGVGVLGIRAGTCWPYGKTGLKAAAGTEGVLLAVVEVVEIPTEGDKRVFVATRYVGLAGGTWRTRLMTPALQYLTTREVALENW